MKVFNLLSLLTLLSFFIVSTGCKKEEPKTSEEGSITLNFNATYGDEALVMLETYEYTDGDLINFGISDFLISDVFVTDSDGNRVDLIDIELIDFDAQNVNAEMAEIPISFSFDSIDPGEYQSITFSVGIDAETNLTRPEDYTPDSPLSVSTRYWQAWDSYIFARFQGDLINPDFGDNVPWLFHTGKDDVFRTFTYALDKSVNDNTVSIDVTIDHKELFKVDAGYMDIRSKPTNHNPQDLEPLITITENFETAVSIK